MMVILVYPSFCGPMSVLLLRWCISLFPFWLRPFLWAFSVVIPFVGPLQCITGLINSMQNKIIFIQSMALCFNLTLMSKKIAFKILWYLVFYRTCMMLWLFDWVLAYYLDKKASAETSSGTLNFPFLPSSSLFMLFQPWCIQSALQHYKTPYFTPIKASACQE